MAMSFQQSKEALLNSSNYVDAQQECDLVLKGGITSGVVYPLAICQLARDYKIRRVGGVSAGAIAAIATVAAEYGRRAKKGKHFAELAALPDELTATDSSKKSLLSRLFQAQPSLKYIFQILLGFIDLTSQAKNPLTYEPRSPLKTGLAYLRFARVILIQGLQNSMVLVTMLLAILVFVAFAADMSDQLWQSSLFGIPNWLRLVLGFGLVMISLVITGLIFSALDAWRQLSRAETGYGICTGLRQGQATTPALSEWMHQLVLRLSGGLQNDAAWLPVHIDHNQRPMVFGDLWQSAESPKSTHPTAILLHTMTTCLTLGRPFVIPFENTQFYFMPSDLQTVLPADVVTWMEQASRAWFTAHPDALPLELSTKTGSVLRLPPAHLLPLVFAARLSLSFPVLLTAVRLWALDENNQAIALWFSDGGIGSNFPVHLYDSPIPLRPTFAINLRAFPETVLKPKPNQADNVFLINSSGQLFPVGITSLGGFFGRVFDTMMNWSDNSVMALDGFRDRIVHVQMLGEEGGANLNMPKAVIERLSERGFYATEHLLNTFNWYHHVWLRYTVSLQNLQSWMTRFARGYSDATFKQVLVQQKPQIVNTYPQVWQEAMAISDALEQFDRNLFTKSFFFFRQTLFPTNNQTQELVQFDLKARPRM